jgi:hypothetical protein
MRYLISALDDLGEMFKGRRIAPIEFCETGRKSLLTSFGYQGMSMIAVASRDMAARDAPARAAGVPVCALLGGSVGPVPAYNSNGLGLRSPTDRRVRSSSRASVRIQLPACNTRIPSLPPSGNPSCTTRRTAASARGRGPARRSQAPIQIAYAQHIAFVLAPAGRIDNVPSEMILGRDNARARTLNESNIVIP